MNCPKCGHPGNSVTDSRPREDDKSIRRRRMCRACGERWTTREVIVLEHKTQLNKDTAINALNAIQDVLLAVKMSGEKVK